MTFTFTKIVKSELVGCKLCRDIYFRPNRTDLIENHLKNEHKINLENASDSDENVSPKPHENSSAKPQPNPEPTYPMNKSAQTSVSAAKPKTSTPKVQEKISVKVNQSPQPTGSLKKPVLTAVRTKNTTDTIPVSPVESKTSTPKPKNVKRKLSALSQLKQEKG